MNLRNWPVRLRSVWRGLLAFLAFAPLLDQSVAAKKHENPGAVTFSIPGGMFTNVVRVELKTASPAVIRFTTDGSEPSEKSRAYKSALTLGECSVLSARAFFPDGRVSGATSESYVLLGNEVRKFSSHLPLIVVNAAGGEIGSGEKSFAGLHVLENLPERTTLPARADFTGTALVRVRGFTSARYAKHSYAVKIVDGLREPHKASVLHLPRESDWVLYGPYPDKTLLRDVLAYELGNAMGAWAPRTRFVEVFLNEGRGKLSMENYLGLYVFEEKITRDKARVNIANLKPGDSSEPEITGGYIFKKDHAEHGGRWNGGAPPMLRGGLPAGAGGFPADPAGFLPSLNGDSNLRNNGRGPARLQRGPVRAVNRPEETEVFPDADSFVTRLQGNLFYYVDPEPDEITAVQRAWLRDYLNRFETALYGADFADPKKGYQAFIERDSFIDFHLLSEVTKNVDAFRFSTFYHKERGQRLKMGPLWDWNLSFGNCDGKQGYLPERWLWPQLNDQEYSWFRRLFEDPDFGQRYVDRWGELRATIFATSNMMARVDGHVARIGEAQERNFRRWPVLGREINPNYFVGATYQEEINWMKRWTSNRLTWIEKQFVAAPVATRGVQLTLTTKAANAQTYFTLDGTDPRASGGVVSAKAKVYETPLKVSKDGKVFARTRVGTRWSPPVILP